MTTRLQDIIEPEKFSMYVTNKSLELNAFHKSGIIRTSEMFNNEASSGGSLVTLPHFNPINTTAPNIGTDDPAMKSSPEKIGAGSQDAVVHYVNNSWSSMDLVASISGTDPMGVIADQVAEYWATIEQTYAIKSINGVIADNMANFGGDMVHDVATDDVGAPTDAELIGPDQVIDARLTLGDMGKYANTLIMHSVVYARLTKMEGFVGAYSSVAPSGVAIDFDTYKGLRVVVDDACPAVMGTNRVTYTSYLAGAGVLAYGAGSPKMGAEIYRDPSAGLGSGQETLYSRRQFILHPSGFKFMRNNVAGKSPTYAELEDPTNWTRVYERKRIPLAVLKTNG